MSGAPGLTVTDGTRDLETRSARPDDHHWIVRSVDDWWGRPVSHAVPRSFLDHFYETSWVTEQRGEPIGFLIGFLSPSVAELAYIHFVGVRPSSRGMGVARHLYRLFFDLARQDGRSHVKAITAVSNAGSIAFHQRMGFEVSEPIEGYDRPGTSHVVFRKML